MSKRLSILVYCCSLGGTGHFVRSDEISRALATRHEVCLVDGGQRVPRAGSGKDGGVRLLALPRVGRVGGKFCSLEHGVELGVLLRRRTELLSKALRDIKPDVLVVEHFPFSKWPLADEIFALIDTAKAVNPRVRIWCSRRDIIPRSLIEGGSELSSDRVLDALHSRFDGVLVHADPALVRLETFSPWTADIRIPVRYTGFVSEKRKLDARSAAQEHGERFAITSGGGAGDGSVQAACERAWDRIGDRPWAKGLALRVMGHPFRAHKARVSASASETMISHEPFAANYLEMLCQADISISHAGYNTCMNILESRCRAVLIPSAMMPDQMARARVLAGAGLARVIDHADLSPESIIEAVGASLTEPRPTHTLDLDGAARTLEILEEEARVPTSVLA